MDLSLAHTLLFWGLPLLFAGLLILLHHRYKNQKRWVWLLSYVLAGYVLLGTYKTASTALTEQQKAGIINEETVQILTEPVVLVRGKTIFMTRCVSCHGAKGEGAVGPNLTDDHWLYGGSIRDIFRTVRYGIPGTPMTGWQHTLSDEDQQSVSNYVYSLYGTNPPNSMPPQGFIYIRKAGGKVSANERKKQADKNHKIS